MAEDAKENSRQVGAVILAGGQSARMGANKALLRKEPGGPTIIERVVARLEAAGLPPTLLVTNTPGEYRFLGIPIAPDDVQGAGALGGILTALNHSQYQRTLIVACDMPCLSPALLRYMAQLHDDSDALAPRWRDGEGRERIEALHAIYSRRCREPIHRRVAAGKLKISKLFGELSVRYLGEEELRRYDPTLESFRNLNTPEDWAQL